VFTTHDKAKYNIFGSNLGCGDEGRDYRIAIAARSGLNNAIRVVYFTTGRIICEEAGLVDTSGACTSSLAVMDDSAARLLRRQKAAHIHPTCVILSIFGTGNKTKILHSSLLMLCGWKIIYAKELTLN